MSSSSLQHLMGLEQVTDRARSAAVQGRGSSSSEQPQPSWDAHAMYNQVVQQQQQQVQQQQQQKYLQQDTDSRFLIVDPSSGAVVGTTNSAATHSERTNSQTVAPAARNISTDVQEKERLAVAASSGLYAPYNFPVPQKRVSSAIFSSELMNSPYFSVDEAMSSASGSILAFPAIAPATMDPAAATAAMQEGFASGIDDYHLLLLAQAAGLMDENGNLLPAFGGQGGTRQGPALPTIHSGTGMTQESMPAGNFNSQEALAAFLHQQQMASNKTSQPDQRWFGVEWNEGNPSGNGPPPHSQNQTSSSNLEAPNFNASAQPVSYPSGLHTSNNQAAWSQPGAGHSSAGHSNYRSEQPTIEALSAEIAALLTLPGTSISQINSLQALLMGNGAGGNMNNISAAQRQHFAPKVPSGNQNNSNWLRGGDDSAGGGYGSDGTQGYVNAGVPTDPWLHPLSGSNGGISRLSGLRRTSGGGDDSAPGSPGPGARNAVMNNSPWSGTLAGLNGDTFTSGMGSPSVPGRQHSLYKTELCRSWDESGSCRYGSKCQFAHGREELRPVQRHGKPKPEGCRAFAMTGSCPYGSRCRFVHNAAPSMVPRAQGRSNSLDTGLQVAPMSDSSSAAQTFRRSLDALIGRHTQQQSDYNTHMLQALRNDTNSFPNPLTVASASSSLLSPLMSQPMTHSSLSQLMPTGLPPMAPLSTRGQSLDLSSNMRGQSLDINMSETPAWQHSLVAAMGGLHMTNSRLGMEGFSLSESQMRGPSLSTVMEPEAMMSRTTAEASFAPTEKLSGQM